MPEPQCANRRYSFAKEKGGGTKESDMPSEATSLQSLAIAAIAAAALLLPMISVAQAEQRADAAAHAKKHAARMHHPTRRETQAYPRIYNTAPGTNAAPGTPGCAWPYQRMFPPCMSTWPEGDPNYHGTMRGNQFE
jgi:hypothetical protein